MAKSMLAIPTSHQDCDPPLIIKSLFICIPTSILLLD